MKIWEIGVLAALLGLNNAFESPARQSFMLELVGAEHLRNAVSLNSVLVNGARMPQAEHAAKVQKWATTHTGLLNGAAMVSVAGVIVGLCFLTYVHSVLAAKERSWMGSLYLVGVVVFAVAGTVSVGINSTLGNDAKHLSTGSVQLMASLAQNLNWGMTSIGLAVMYFAVGHLIRRTDVLPSWLAWVSWFFALTGATFFLAFVPLLLQPPRPCCGAAGSFVADAGQCRSDVGALDADERVDQQS